MIFTPNPNEPHLHLDFETRSAHDLKTYGAWNYSKHHTTDIICMAYSFGEEVKLWTFEDCDFPNEVIHHVRKKYSVIAHNAQFEYSMWNNCLVKLGGFIPHLSLDQTFCTMSYAYAMSLPGALEDAAKVMNLKAQKNMEGHRIMMQLSRPRTKDPLTWWELNAPKDKEKDRQIIREKYDKLYAYCRDDVRVEMELEKKLMKLNQVERKVWVLDQKINERGIKVDVSLLNVALQVADFEKNRMSREVREITDGQVSSLNATFALHRWIKDQGVEFTSLDKESIVSLMKEDLPYDVKRVLELRQLGGKSSTAKLEAMIDFSDPEDSRVRHSFQYHAASTGRWGGRKIQPQNFPRPTMTQDSIDNVFEMLANSHPEEITQALDMFHGNPVSVISNCLRGFIIPEIGYDLIAADFSSIEARVLAWLAGEESVLEIFRTSGLIYEHAAAKIYGIPLEKVTKERFIGKVATLALGYQGGKKAFQNMARIYGVDLDEDTAETIKNQWRDAHPNIVGYWYELEKAAMDAIKNPKIDFFAGAKGRRVSFRRIGKFLWCKLPSERLLCYPFPDVTTSVTPWGAEKEMMIYEATSSYSRSWQGHKAYGGLLAENITQAVARDVLANAMLNLEANKYSIVMHVHDEVVCEVPEGFGSVEEMQHLMCTLPQWANGLPISAEGYRSKRYRK